VAQGRAPVLYENYGVPDTVAGRFEMIVLHTVLLVGRLKHGSSLLRRPSPEGVLATPTAADDVSRETNQERQD
jgi:cytochrome b pre-mRNA-processing protein 3